MIFPINKSLTIPITIHLADAFKIVVCTNI